MSQAFANLMSQVNPESLRGHRGTSCKELGLTELSAQLQVTLLSLTSCLKTKTAL